MSSSSTHFNNEEAIPSSPKTALNLATERISQYKNALKTNRQHSANAYESAIQIYELVKEQAQLALDTGLDWSDLCHEIPPLPPALINQPIISTIPDLKSRIQAQIDSCIAASAFYFTRGKKPLALKFHRFKKSLVSDLLQVQALSDSTPWPSMHTCTVKYQHEVVFKDLLMTEYELTILNLSDLKLISNRPMPIEIEWDIGYPNAETGKGLIRVEYPSSNHLEINQSFRIKMDRNKTLIRHLERRKIQFQVTTVSNGIFGLGVLCSRVSIGNAAMKLSDLLTKASIQHTVKLVDYNRKPVGGVIEFRVRLRQPVVRPELVERTEQWISITPLQTSDTTVLPASPTQLPTLPPPTVPPLAATAAQAVDVQSSIQWLESVDSLESCLVLEHELQILKLSPDSDRDSALSLKLQLLRLNVELGTLTMDAYADQLNKSREVAKYHVLILKRASRMDLVKRGLKWIQLMNQELDELKSMA